MNNYLQMAQVRGEFFIWNLFSGTRPAGISLYQLHRCNQLLQTATTKSSFYQRKLQHAPKQLDELSALAAIPITTRSELQAAAGTVHVRNLPSWAYRNPGTTSGSTGEPLTFYCTPYGRTLPKVDQWYIYSKLWRPLLWAGSSDHTINHSMKMVQLSHHRNVPRATQLFIDPHEFDRDPDKICRQVMAFAPQVISCYASFMLSLCKHLKEKGVELRIPYVILNGETATCEQRDFIEEVLGGTTVSRYGLEETYWSIASETFSERGLIPYYESVIIEIITDEGLPARAGENGRIIITDLMNHVHPFIRYETGDRGRVIEQSGPYLRFDILGRTANLTFPTGTLTHYFVNVLIAPLSRYVSRYQFIKRGDDQLACLIVPAPGYSYNVERSLYEGIAKKLPRIKLEIKTVPSLPRSRAGKTPPFLNEAR